jgi:hypothetical protein
VVKLLVLLVTFGAAAELSAQIVRGTVRDAESGAPLAGVFVVLLDSLDHTRGGVLTGENGRFALRASWPGTYRLRAERIGHQSTLSQPVVLTEAAASVVDLRAAVAAVELAAVEVAGDSRCTMRPRTGARTAQLWEEVRKALSVARWVQSQKTIEFESVSWLRNFKMPSMAVVAESLTHRVSTTLPYAAIPAGTLTRFGFVQQDLGDAVFYGPDADVLLSEEFLQSHCFESVEGRGVHANQVGLTFKPIEGNKLPDIAGTLWLDAGTLELRHIEYSYVNLADPMREGAGGRTDFRRLPTGAWIVSNWHIRVPATVEFERGRMTVLEMRETGGLVTAVRKPTQHENLARAGVISGLVHDSVRGRPLADALVYLSGTTHRAQTDTAGRFAISGVPEGAYSLAFTHPVLDSMPALPLPREVRVAALDTTAADLGTSSFATQLALCCGGKAGGVLFGYVRDTDGTVSNALVSATFQRNPKAGGDPRVEQTIRLEVRTDASGQYLFCGLPFDSPVQLRAARRDEPPVRATASVHPLPYHRVDLQLRH